MPQFIDFNPQKNICKLILIRFYYTVNVQKGGRRFDMFPSLDPRITESILEIVQDRRIVGILGIGGLLWTSPGFLFFEQRPQYYLSSRKRPKPSPARVETATRVFVPE
jgi:hypothetical protein